MIPGLEKSPREGKGSIPGPRSSTGEGISYPLQYSLASLVAQLVKNPCNVRNLGSIPGFGRSPEEGSGYPLQNSCLENSTDKGAWQATVHEVAKSRTRRSSCHIKHKHIILFNAG